MQVKSRICFPGRDLYWVKPVEKIRVESRGKNPNNMAVPLIPYYVAGLIVKVVVEAKLIYQTMR